MYFGDHIEENLFRTADGHLHESLAAAQDHRRRSFAEHRRDHAAARVINGVRLGPEGAETWEVVDPTDTALAGYDGFVWYDSTTGLNHRTESLEEAVAFDAEQIQILDCIDAAEAATRIERSIQIKAGSAAFGSGWRKGEFHDERRCGRSWSEGKEVDLVSTPSSTDCDAVERGHPPHQLSLPIN